MAIIKLDNVTYFYPRRSEPALMNISLEINEGEFVALMGRNGSGKTSFCKLINGVIPHSHGGRLDGSVIVDGYVTSETQVHVLASRAAAVHDDPDTQLFTDSVRSELAFGPENLRVPADEIRDRVARGMEAAGLTESADMPPSALSGGQKQRLAIAAALAMRPRILVLDEPTSQLDPWNARDVLAMITELRKRAGMTVIMATHNSEEAAEYADKICVLREGRLAACGSPREIFSKRPLFEDNLLQRPDVSQLAAFLADRGWPLPSFPVRHEEALAAILEKKGN